MSERPSWERVRVLLVDDDPAFRDLGVETLDRREGLSAEGASTPREALDALRDRAVDVVVSDVDMPGSDGDGADLYRTVRGRWPTMPFVFFTGTPPESLSASVELRTDPSVGYVRKGSLPARYRALARRIERIVERDRTTGSPNSVARTIAAFCR